MSRSDRAPALGALHRWLLVSEWRAHPVRALVALMAIAVGIALGFGIHLINDAALSEFSAAARSLSGHADLQVRGKGVGFDERLYPDIAALPGIEVAAPVLELDLALPGQRSPLKILGIDGFRSAAISPDLLGVPDEGKALDSLMADTVFLSPATLQWLGLKTGDTLAVIAGASVVPLRVAGTLTRARPGQRLAVMDIGSAQWQFRRLGQLSRIDLRLQPGARSASVKAAIERLDPSLVVVEQEDQDRRTASMSRAYRVNLNVLALVALFTGAFLVFSTQALSVLRRRPQFALLRTIGMSRNELLLQVLAEGALLGTLGALLGLFIGYGLAALAVSLFGGDLGGGYFPGVQPSLNIDPLASLLFFVSGVGVAVLGSLSPALEAARARPAAALKAGSEDLALAPLSLPWPAMVMIISGVLLTQLPPVGGLPVFGYLAIALLLIGSIALMPRLASIAFARLAQRHTSPIASLALSRLANAPNQAGIALGGVLASFALMVAMAIMVTSFRASVDDWLRHLLSADVYVRVVNGGEAGRLGPTEQQAIAQLPAVQRMELTRHQPVILDPARPAVALIARSIDVSAPERTLPMVSAGVNDAVNDGAGKANSKGNTERASERPVWVSEAMTDLYGWQPGQQVELPINGQPVRFTVAGIWRDYARQSGAVMMRIEDYRQLSGDKSANDVALWIKSGVPISSLKQQLTGLPFAASLELAEPAEIHAISLTIFDRSFVITYLLEGVAMVIGLFGVASTFSAQTLSRAKEFGMLRHLGITRGQILTLLAGEGALLAALAIVAGFVLGVGISLILVFIVNPQSFHWTMEFHLPRTLLVTVAGALLVSASLTALASGRFAVSGSALRAVREDW